MKLQYKLFMTLGLAILSVGSWAASGAAGPNPPAPAGSGASVVGKVKFTGALPQPSAHEHEFGS